MKWMIFLAQIPSSPSTLRVMVWRRMRDAGALGLQNGVWVLPDNDEYSRFADELRQYLEEHEASCLVFHVDAVEGITDEEILERLRAERDEEYREFIERCDVLMDDLATESEQERFNFAELEEAEADLKKLDTWWEKCIRRDFVDGSLKTTAEEKLQSCHQTFESFSGKVYERHAAIPEAEQSN